MDISFDDLLDAEPEKRTSIRVTRPQPKAGKPFRREEDQETRANWKAPEPEALVLFWSRTICCNCGSSFEHPTYQQNATLVRYRVSRFRTLLRPYNHADARKYIDLPRLREVTQHTVLYCSACFDEHALLDGDHTSSCFEDQLDLFPEISCTTIPPSIDEKLYLTAIKPFIPVATDEELDTMK